MRAMNGITSDGRRSIRDPRRVRRRTSTRAGARGATATITTIISHRRVPEERMKGTISRRELETIRRGVRGVTRRIIIGSRIPGAIRCIVAASRGNMVVGLQGTEAAETETTTTTTAVAPPVATKRRKRKPTGSLRGRRAPAGRQVDSQMTVATTTTDPATATEKTNEEITKTAARGGMIRMRRTPTNTASNSSSLTADSSTFPIHEPEISKISTQTGRRLIIVAITTAGVTRVAVKTKMPTTVEQKIEIARAMTGRKSHGKPSRRAETRTSTLRNSSRITRSLATEAQMPRSK